MALSSEQFGQLESLLLRLETGANPVARVREELPGIAVSRCDADDMRGETAYRRSGGYQLFLVDTSNHCWRIVDDLQSANGVVIAG